MSAEHRPVWAPDAVDIEVPSAARMYDYYLDGSHNFAADRALAEQAMRSWPNARQFVQANRAFLTRAVAMLAHQGIDQFLDLGSGIPTVGNVHEVALSVNPDARTLYVDSDAVAHAHGTALLASVPQAHYLRADVRDPWLGPHQHRTDRLPRPYPPGRGAHVPRPALHPR